MPTAQWCHINRKMYWYDFSLNLSLFCIVRIVGHLMYGFQCFSVNDGRDKGCVSGYTLPTLPTESWPCLSSMQKRSQAFLYISKLITQGISRKPKKIPQTKKLEPTTVGSKSKVNAVSIFRGNARRTVPIQIAMGQKLTLTFNLRAGHRCPCDFQADGLAGDMSQDGAPTVTTRFRTPFRTVWTCSARDRPRSRGLRATSSVPVRSVRPQFRSGKHTEVSRFVLVLNFRSWFPAQLGFTKVKFRSPISSHNKMCPTRYELTNNPC